MEAIVSEFTTSDPRCLAVLAKRERDALPKPPPKKRGRPKKPAPPLPLFGEGI